MRKRAIIHTHVKVGDVLMNPFNNLWTVRRIHNQRVAIFESVDQNVIEHSALFVRHKCVTDITDREFCYIIGDD